MRLHRLLGILMLLDSRGSMKAAKLAKILETSERTIYRDIDILCEAGIPIQSISGPTGGYSFMENYRIKAKDLESADIVNLLFSSMGIQPEKNSETAHQLKNAVIKLENSIAPEHREEIIKAKERFFIDSEPWWGKGIQIQSVDIIKQAVLDLSKLKFLYRKFDGEASIRLVRPYGVVVKNNEWYMVAFCEDKNDIRVFKCSRMSQVEVQSASFQMPEDFSLEIFWERSKHQFVRQSASKAETLAYLAKLKLYEEDVKALEGFHVHASSKVEDYWIRDIDMLSFETACHVLFPLSDRLEVVSPLELRRYMIEKTKKIIHLYKLKESLT